MTPELWRLVETLFAEAAELPPDRRDSFWDAHARMQPFAARWNRCFNIWRPRVTASTSWSTTRRSGSPGSFGRQLGAYRVVKLIGGAAWARFTPPRMRAWAGRWR